MNHQNTQKLSVPRDLYEKIGNKEKAIQIIKIGLISLTVSSLETEIADLIEKTKNSKRRIAEMPAETTKLEEILKEAIKDREMLENLLDRKR